jgi:uncharacterized protein
MNLPTQEQCLQYFETYKVPNNIKKHCLKVQEVALFLAFKLKEAGVKVDVELVSAGAVLHDLFKMAAIKDILSNNKYHDNFSFTEEQLTMREELRKKYPGKHENKIAYEIFKDEFPELALTLLRESDHDLKDKKLEESLINYVDYIIFKEKIVPLQKRFDYFMEIYNPPKEYWQRALDQSKETEQMIFKKLDIKPEELQKVMNYE